MATLNHDNPFQSWILTKSEYYQGAILTDLQIKNIQNQRAEIMLRQANLVFDPKDPVSYALERAHLQGQVDALNYQLEASTLAISAMSEDSKLSPPQGN